MNAGWFLTYHEIPELLQSWLAGLGVRDPERGARDLIDLTRRAGPERLDRIARIAVQLDAVLPRCPDPGMALTNLERFLAAVRRLDETLDQLVGDARTTEILLQVFSTSQYFSEVLIRDPELFDWLQRRRRAPRPRGPDRGALGHGRRARRPRMSRSWPCGGSASARACGSATTTSSAASRWR